MEPYDPVAEDYAAVFGDIGVRLFEWPWIRGLVREKKPRSLLDLGCGNGYLSKALEGTVPERYALEPSPVMCSIAEKNLGGGVVLLRGAAESMPFGDGSFDMVISLLSFRYMAWDRALDEIYRVLKKDGVFILVDLFAGSFNPLYFPGYLAAWAAVRIHHMRNRGYYKKLRRLTRSAAWRRLVREHPRRSLSDARAMIKGKFYIERFRILGAGLRGSTAGLVCGKRAPF
ncbi:MAG: class I SAM-dependent methyltransferase [Spirochaetaceae bacterium]|jgi:ubiquinone/menaquinone biosynthesis C-methylase UbiE|nr:class I SAM-dependent methyltransferase [Spirochaetaceae bacterium]